MYKIAKRLTAVDAAYLAGLIDGEGTVSLVKHRKEQRRPIVSIANTDYRLVEWPLKATGVGVICKKRGKAQPHHKDSWIYSVTARQALAVLGQIEPYLKNADKRRRAELLLTHYERVTPRNGKYTADMLVKRKAFDSLFFLK